MELLNKKKAIILLEDGTYWEGYSYGAPITATGEICFNTGMTGYQEIFTDPSYLGQILVTTNVHIGNYGINDKEVESSSVKISALVCRNFSIPFNRKDSNGNIQDYLFENKIPVISDIDTRSLVRHIRNKGAMNAIVSSEIADINELKKQLAQVPSMAGLQLSDKVSTPTPYFSGDENAHYKVAVIDLGLKDSIVNCLVERDCYCKVFPIDSKLEDILDFNPDGIMITNGPGDPSVMQSTIALVSNLIDSNIPMFGICLGHQIISLTQGLKTEKMFNGHRGINHPILNIETNRAEITSQNHGFVVEEASLNDSVVVTHRHLNDNSIAGIKVKGKSVFSVQYHPEASAGPHDSRYLFDDFINLMKS
jgi:carbamoyl-phosphate synthase small subunit